MFDASAHTLTLASASPRRRELLAGLGLEFAVEPSKGGDETYPDTLPHLEIPLFLSRRKSENFHRPLAKGEILITADTLVLLDSRVLGKPADRDDAFRILRSLSGRTHQVVTGVTLRSLEKTVSFSETADVTFAPFTGEDIAYYADNFNPYDKAGAYGIQDWIGLAFISSIRGSYFNVMGLPVHRLYKELADFVK